jgi:uncharacterized membrane protein
MDEAPSLVAWVALAVLSAAFWLVSQWWRQRPSRSAEALPRWVFQGTAVATSALLVAAYVSGAAFSTVLWWLAFAVPAGSLLLAFVAMAWLLPRRLGRPNRDERLAALIIVGYTLGVAGAVAGVFVALNDAMDEVPLSAVLAAAVGLLLWEAAFVFARWRWPTR